MTRPRSRFGHQRWPAGRRLRIILGRRLALALGLASLACSGGVALAADNANQLVTATVYAPGQAPAPDSVSIGTLESDPQNCQTYSGPDNGFQGPGGDAALPSASTWPLSSVLTCLAKPVSISDVTQVTVFKQAGSPEAGLASQLSRSDLKNPSDFPLVLQSPVITSDGSNIIYNRPSRGPSDNNAFDQAVAVSPAPFLLDVFEGPPLSVVATASTTKVSPGGNVTFGEVLTPPSQTGLIYDWTFDGVAADSASPTPSVRFPAPGTYPVTLQVTDAAGGGGTGTITITVGRQPAPFGGGTHQQPGTGKSPKSKSPTGPQSSGGAHVGGPAGKSKPNHSGATPVQKHQSGAPDQSPSKGSKPTVRKPKGARRKRTTAPAKPPTPPPAFNPAEAPLITGRLVSDVRVLPAGASPLVHTTQAPVATAPPARRAVQASLLPALGGVLAVFLIFTLGAGRELRGWSGRRALRAGG